MSDIYMQMEGDDTDTTPEEKPAGEDTPAEEEEAGDDMP